MINIDNNTKLVTMHVNINIILIIIMINTIFKEHVYLQ